jgi:tetratricopeptide (TPR) repeat protein
MSQWRTLKLLTAALLAVGTTGLAAAKEPRAFELSTRSADAKKLLREVQARIERFQFGPPTIEVAKSLVAADPQFALGAYYLSAVSPSPENDVHLAQAVKLAQKASDGERRFIEALAVARANNGANFKDGIPALEALSKDYPGERVVWAILGQMYQNASRPADARRAYEKAQAIVSTPRVRAFLASDDLLAGRYDQARATFQALQQELPADATPFAVHYGIVFSHLYQGQVDPALETLHAFVKRYRDLGASQNFPEVFLWNSIARVNLEHGRLDAALAAYEKGYESVPGSSLPDDQKKTWLGRLHHGKCRVLAKMGRHDEAWQEAETVRTMIEAGGQEGKQYVPAYHYLAGYVLLEKGDARAALEHLKQADPDDPFHQLLLARAYEKLGDASNARKTYAGVAASTVNNLERALAYPEAKRKLG